MVIYAHVSTRNGDKGGFHFSSTWFCIFFFYRYCKKAFLYYFRKKVKFDRIKSLLSKSLPASHSFKTLSANVLVLSICTLHPEQHLRLFWLRWAVFQQFSFTCLHSIPTALGEPWESWCFLCIYILKIPFCSFVTVPFTWVASPFSSPAPYHPQPLPRGWVGQGIILSALGLGHRRHLISPQLLSSCK